MVYAIDTSDPLDLRLELFAAGAWQDVTLRAWPDSAAANATLTWGQSANSQSAASLSLPVTLTNNDGNLTPGNLASPWYPDIGTGTLARLSVAGEVRMRTDAEGFARCPTVSAMHAAGTVDVRVDCMLSDWSAGGILAGQNPDWQLEVGSASGLLDFAFQDSSSVLWVATCPVQPQPGRRCLRAVLDNATGHVQFYAGPAGGIDGSTWTALGDPVVTGSGAVTLTTASTLALAGVALGSWWAAEARIAGTAVWNPAFGSAAVGAGSLTDTHSNTWTVQSPAEISDRDYLAHGSLASVQAQSSGSGALAAVAAVIGGPLRVQAQGYQPVVMSPMRRALTTRPPTLAPVAYWPCEDAGGTALASALSFGAPMAFDRVPQFAADGSFPGSLPLPRMAGSRWSGHVDSAPIGSANSVLRALVHPGGAGTDGSAFLRLVTTGTAALVDVRWHAGGGLSLAGLAADGTTVFDSGTLDYASELPGDTIQQPLWISVEVLQGTGVITYALVALALGATSGAGNVLGSYAGAIGRPTHVYVNVDGTFTDWSAGHISVQSHQESLFGLWQPFNAYPFEPAAMRLARVCGENGTPVQVIGAPSVSVLMGPQPVASEQQITQECAAADGGVLHEAPGAYAVAYRTLASMLNQAPAIAIDVVTDRLNGAYPPSPLTSDDGLVSDFTAQSADGTSARAVSGDWTGIPHADSGQYNLPDAASLLDQASMQVARGTASPRYPSLTVDPGLLSSAQATAAARVRAGDVIEVTSIPATTDAAGSTRQVIPGGSTALGPGRRMTWAAQPASAYDTMTWDDPVAGRWDSDVVTLHAAITSTATSLVVDVDGVLVTTDGGDFPVDLAVGGEHVIATACSGTSSPQALTVTRGTPSLAWAAGTPVRLWRPSRWAPF